MSHLRRHALAGLAALAAISLAACADRTPQPAPGTTTGAQTEGIEDTRTEPSEAARAQQSGEAMPGAEADPMGAPMPGAPPAPMLNQLASLGGAMHAAVELCDPAIGQAQLADARERQQQEFVRLGGEAVVFDEAFTTAHGQVRAQYNGATPAQRQQMCAELQAMAEQAPPNPTN